MLIVEGNLNAFKEDKDKWLSMSIEDHMKLYLESGLSTKEAMKRVALDRGTSKRDIYSQYCIRKE